MNIPIFVPHVGCPHDCAFCNQRSITGVQAAPSIEEARRTIEAYLSGGRRGNSTIAFFGGSFTAIDPAVQGEYLALAKEYRDKGLVDGIRLSTRPDCISDEILSMLAEYGVTNIELGAQSMDDCVLKAANRGHDRSQVCRASELIRNHGFILGLQMMTGLPLDTPETAMATARSFVELGADETRIYPTLVMEGTALAQLFKRGEYRPQTLEEATSLGAELYAVFRQVGVKVLRIGLSYSEELSSGCIAGPCHAAIGELVKGRYVRNQLESLVENGILRVRAPKTAISKILGNKRCNADYFARLGVSLTVETDDCQPTVNEKYTIDVG